MTDRVPADEPIKNASTQERAELVQEMIGSIVDDLLAADGAERLEHIDALLAVPETARFVVCELLGRIEELELGNT